MCRWVADHIALHFICVEGTADWCELDWTAYYVKVRICCPICQMNVHVSKKDGSWNPMVSAHPKGHIFADLVIGPYCFMGEQSIHM